jgi:hypothetical protein
VKLVLISALAFLLGMGAWMIYGGPVRGWVGYMFTRVQY